MITENRIRFSSCWSRKYWANNDPFAFFVLINEIAHFDMSFRINCFEFISFLEAEEEESILKRNQ